MKLALEINEICNNIIKKKKKISIESIQLDDSDESVISERISTASVNDSLLLAINQLSNENGDDEKENIDKNDDEENEDEIDGNKRQDEDDDEGVYEDENFNDTFVMTRRGGSIHDDSFTIEINVPPKKKVTFRNTLEFIEIKKSSQEEDDDDDEDDGQLKIQKKKKQVQDNSKAPYWL